MGTLDKSMCNLKQEGCLGEALSSVPQNHRLSDMEGTPEVIKLHSPSGEGISSMTFFTKACPSPLEGSS